MVVRFTTLGAILFLTALAAGGAAGYSIYFDDYHDTDFDDLSGNLSIFTATLLSAGHTIESFDQPITQASLTGYDVAMLFDAEEALSADELDALQWFVQSGWGIWVVGEWFEGEFDVSSYDEFLSPYEMGFTSDFTMDDYAISLFNHETMDGVPYVSLSVGGILWVGPESLPIAEAGEGYVGGVYDGHPNLVGRVAVWADASSFVNDYVYEGYNPVYIKNTARWLGTPVPEPVLLGPLAGVVLALWSRIKRTRL